MRIPSFFLLLSSLWTLPSGLLQAQGWGTIQGTTLDGEGLPLVFVSIGVYDASGEVLITGTASDADGRYRLVLEAPNTYVIKPSYRGLKGDTPTVELGEGQIRLLDLTIPDPMQVIRIPWCGLKYAPRLVDPVGGESTHTMDAEAIRRWR